MTRHDPLFMSCRQGCWAECSCGWLSGSYTTVSGAVIAHGGHLTNPPTDHPHDEPGVSAGEEAEHG